MLKSILGRVNSAHVIALAALFVALGGTAFALSKNSVKSKHIKDGQVKSADIKNDNVKSADLKNEGVKGKDIKDGEIGTSKIKDGAVTESKLAAGVLPGDEDPCGPGKPKAVFMVHGSSLTTTFETLSGYHCDGGTIEARSPSTGNYEFDIEGLAFDTTTEDMVVQLTGQGGSGGTIIGYGAGGTFDRLSVQTYDNAGGAVDKVFSVTVWEDSPPAP